MQRYFLWPSSKSSFGPVQTTGQRISLYRSWSRNSVDIISLRCKLPRTGTLVYLVYHYCPRILLKKCSLNLNEWCILHYTAWIWKPEWECNICPYCTSTSTGWLLPVGFNKVLVARRMRGKCLRKQNCYLLKWFIILLFSKELPKN